MQTDTNPLNRIRQILTSPVFAGDEEKTRVAALLNGVLLISMPSDVMVAASMAAPGMNTGVGLAVVGTLFALKVAALLLIRRGRVYEAGWIFSSVMWLMFTSLTVFFGGAEGPITICYVTVVLVAALTLSGPGAITFTLLSVIAQIALHLGGEALPEQAMEVTPAFVALVRSANLAILGVGLFFAMRHLGGLRADEVGMGAELGGPRLERIARAGRVVEEEKEDRLLGQDQRGFAFPEAALQLRRQIEQAEDLIDAPLLGDNPITPPEGTLQGKVDWVHASLLLWLVSVPTGPSS